MGMRLGCHKNKLYNVHICGEISVIVKNRPQKDTKLSWLKQTEFIKRKFTKKNILHKRNNEERISLQISCKIYQHAQFSIMNFETLLSLIGKIWDTHKADPSSSTLLLDQVKETMKKLELSSADILKIRLLNTLLKYSEMFISSKYDSYSLTSSTTKRVFQIGIVSDEVEPKYSHRQRRESQQPTE